MNTILYAMDDSEKTVSTIRFANALNKGLNTELMAHDQ